MCIHHYNTYITFYTRLRSQKNPSRARARATDDALFCKDDKQQQQQQHNTVRPRQLVWSSGVWKGET